MVQRALTDTCCRTQVSQRDRVALRSCKAFFGFAHNDPVSRTRAYFAPGCLLRVQVQFGDGSQNAGSQLFVCI
jgi:hypothetical protein